MPPLAVIRRDGVPVGAAPQDAPAPEAPAVLTLRGGLHFRRGGLSTRAPLQWEPAATEAAFTSFRRIDPAQVETLAREGRITTFSRPPTATIDGAVREAGKVRVAVRLVLDHPPFELCTTTQLRDHGRQLQEVAKRITRLRETLRNVRRASTELQRLRRAVEDWERQLTYQRRDLEAFQALQLGELAVVEMQP